MSHIYISEETDPYFNVAAEYQLFSEAEEDVSLFLWQNEPAVIFGRNQNVYAECDVSYLKQAGILPVRRFSGGGAVYQDLGNLNFTFFAKEHCADPDTFLSVIKQAMDLIGVECAFSGRNDLLCQGKKFSGHAYFVDNGNYLYHGTIMVNVDMDRLSGALSPSLLKLQSKGIASVRSRVINLSQVNSLITIDAVKVSMIKAFRNVYGKNHPVIFVDRSILQPEHWAMIQEKDWIFGEAPRFSIREERKLSFGLVSLSVDAENGRIQRLKIHTDSLYSLDFTTFEREWVGAFFEINELFHHIEKYASASVPFICYNQHIRSEGKDNEN
ncbi:lipoate--protein ligase [Paenibacillus jamilae]|uniref:lipoate--protein ligase n=1 Tax=Paenibacillus jamilae TaxID=114136 RepID=UPI003D2950C3